MNEEILDLIIKRAAEVFGVDESTLSGDTHFEDDLQAKSANIVLITTVLEDEYDVEIPYMEFRRKKTFQEAADFIEELVEG